MSWFDATGLTSLAKSALKEAQRTIDKALDIEENEENVVPSSSSPTTTASVSSKSLQEKLKDESDHFFASFGLEKKKSPLTPANTPVEASVAPSSAYKEEGKMGGSGLMMGSLWGSFTGSFFENAAAKQETSGVDEGGDSVASSGVVGEKNIVATQPPRTSTSLPSLQLSPLSPVSTQPRTASLEEHTTTTTTTTTPQHQWQEEREEVQDGDRGSEAGQDWGGWGWESSIMVVPGHQHTLDGEEVQGPGEELEGRGEDSLADDSIDVEGFARSRLVVGSVDSDSTSLTRQESQGSLSGPGGDPDVPSAIPEDVFYEQTTERQPGVMSSCREGDSASTSGKLDSFERRTTVSNVNSEVNTPDSIVVLTSDSSSPDAELTSTTRTVTNLGVALSASSKLVSPISSPESIEVLGSSSIVTSPSSIEVLSGVSSSDSSPTHQDSCNDTLIQDLSPSVQQVVSTQPTAQPSHGSPHQEASSQPPATEGSRGDTLQDSTSCQADQTIVRQPTHHLEKCEDLAGTEVIGSPPRAGAVDLAVMKESSGGDSSSSFHTCLTDDASASESIHSASTSSTHTVLDSSLLTSDQPLNTNTTMDSGILEAVEQSLPAGPSELSISSEPHEPVVPSEQSLPSSTLESVEPSYPSHTSVPLEPAAEHSLPTRDESIPEVAMKPGEDKQGETQDSKEPSEVPVAEEGAPAAPLDVSVESGGSSDTITASLDSSQMAWSGGMKGSMEQESGASAGEGLQESGQAVVVRCLLEEAMGDEEATSGASSPPEREHSPSSSERSEALKVGSGHTSGHSSGDEVETTTSSDIEVISSPSLDGSTVARTAASRVWTSAQRGFRSILNDRSESPASDSSGNNHRKVHSEKGETVPSSMTTSFTSISESEGEPHNLLDLGSLDPSHITHVLLQDHSHFEKGHRRNQSNFSETSESSSENHSSEVDKLLKKVAQLTEVLEARESKVLELSQTNAALMDTNQRFKCRMEELEGGYGSEATESVREEFTQRLVTMERKFQQALREKEATKKLLEEVKAEAATRLSSTEVARDREERDTVIRELREEGEKLSKQQLNYATVVKKLRTKEKENDTTIKTQKDKLEEQSRELERLRKQLSAKEEVERRQIDAVCQLNTTNQRLDQMLKEAHANNAEVEGKMTALKSALDTSYREVAELQKAVAAKDVEAQEQALSAEVGLRKQLEATLLEAEEQARRDQAALMAQVVELQDVLERCESQANRRERQLRGDIGELQQRVSEADGRAEELSGAVSAATRPLLRQMENLQSTHSSQQAAWESLESSLTKRLNEAQTAAATSIERERGVREQYAQAAAAIAALQTQVANLRAENTKLSSQLDVAASKLEAVAESRTKETTQIEALKASFAEEIGEVKRERDSLEQQLEMEKTAVAAEKKKCHALQEQLKDRERKLVQLTAAGAAAGGAETHSSTPRSSPTPSLSRLSMSGSFSESMSGSQWGDEVFETSWSRGTSLYDTMRGNTTSTVDALTSQLRQREGEVHHLHSEVARYEAQRESLAQELVSATAQLEAQQAQLQDLQTLKGQYVDMEQKYNALLQMHGEKVEEVEELRLDLADVKEMYKAQIDQLLQK